MSKIPDQEAYLEDCQADLDQFLCESRWTDARALIDNLREQGYDAERFQGQFNRAWFLQNLMRTPGITFKSV